MRTFPIIKKNELWLILSKRQTWQTVKSAIDHIVACLIYLDGKFSLIILQGPSMITSSAGTKCSSSVYSLMWWQTSLLIILSSWPRVPSSTVNSICVTDVQQDSSVQSEYVITIMMTTIPIPVKMICCKSRDYNVAYRDLSCIATCTWPPSCSRFKHESWKRTQKAWQFSFGSWLASNRCILRATSHSTAIHILSSTNDRLKLGAA